MPAPLQFGAQFLEVVNLAVEDHPDRFIGIRHGLMAPTQIDDRKTAEPETERAGHEITFVIGSSMKDGASHARDGFARDSLIPGEVKLSGYAAHGSDLPPRRKGHED